MVSIAIDGSMATRLGAAVRIATRVKTPMKVAMAMKLMKGE
jgi:hypothetical protein